MQEIETIFYIIVLLVSVIIHEVSHGYAAKFLGDDTADRAGRLTLNPLKHLDPIGSVLIPLLLIISKTGFVFGWAKPVPYNEFNLKNKKWGTVIVAAAGAFSNLTIAVIFGLLIRLSVATGLSSSAFLSICGLIVLVNIVLGVFNLIPIPPLDGSHVLYHLLPGALREPYRAFQRFGFLPLLALMLLFPGAIRWLLAPAIAGMRLFVRWASPYAVGAQWNIFPS